MQGNLLFTINCGGHIEKVGQSKTKFDDFEREKNYICGHLGGGGN